MSTDCQLTQWSEKCFVRRWWSCLCTISSSLSDVIYFVKSWRTSIYPSPVCLSSILIRLNVWYLCKTMLDVWSCQNLSPGIPRNYQFKMPLFCLASFRLCDQFAHAFQTYWTYFWAISEEVGSSKGEKKEFHQTQMNCMWNTLTIVF